jgi:hypothetical protein
VRFAYLPLPTRRPVYSRGGLAMRYRPIVPVHVLAPQPLLPTDCCIDSASDDTLFPVRFARRLGIDLAGAPQGEAQPAGHPPLPVRYGRVTLLLADGFESCEGEAVVAFLDVPMRWPLLGHAGFLDFFDVQLLGARREAVLAPNNSFSGRHIVHRPPPP